MSRLQRRTTELGSAAFSMSLLGAALTLSASIYTETTHAAIFKCVDADGNTSYNQTPCPTDTQTQKVIAKTGASSNAKSAADCRIANNFARQVATQMIAGTPSGSLFDSYGGIDSIPRTSVGVISYVYSHNGNQDNNIERITSLSAARCSAGSYGSVTCDDFPHAFIAELGGCDLATKKTLPVAADNEPETMNEKPAAAQPESTSAAIDSNANCQETVKAKLAAFLGELQSGQASDDPDALAERQAKLQGQMQSCQSK